MDHGLVHGATLVLPDRLCHGGMIWQDGLLKEIFEEASQVQEQKSQLRQQALKETIVWDMEGDLLIPGLIDTHVHGAGGSDVMDGNIESLQNLTVALLKEGTTAFLATTMSCIPEQLKRVMQNVADFHLGDFRGAEILGLHLEGPFLAKEFRGAQATELIWDQDKDGSAQFLVTLLHDFPHLVKIITFAPERPDGRELAEVCLAHGVIPSAGHTGSDFAQMEQAVQWGVRHITHAFNAMPAIHHRNPGLLTKALLDETITMELIADGVHIHPAVLDLVLRNKPPERVCLISDGTRAVGMPDGEYELGGNTVIVRHGLAQLPDGTIAGSVYPLRQGLKMLVHKLQYPLPEAIRYAASNPAKLLRIDNRVGSLEINKEATFIRLSSGFDVKQVWLRGRLVFDATEI